MTGPAQDQRRSSATLRAGVLDLEVLRRGEGRAILLIHGVNPISPRAPFVDLLAITCP